jgi:hypothetical protein
MRKTTRTWTLTITIFLISETIFSLWLFISGLHSKLLSIVTLLAISFALSVSLCSRLSHWQNKFQLEIAIVAHVMHLLSLTTLLEASQILFVIQLDVLSQGTPPKPSGGALSLVHLWNIQPSHVTLFCKYLLVWGERGQLCLLIRILWVIRICWNVSKCPYYQVRLYYYLPILAVAYSNISTYQIRYNIK